MAHEQLRLTSPFQATPLIILQAKSSFRVGQPCWTLFGCVGVIGPGDYEETAHSAWLDEVATQATAEFVQTVRSDPSEDNRQPSIRTLNRSWAKFKGLWQVDNVLRLPGTDFMFSWQLCCPVGVSPVRPCF